MKMNEKQLRKEYADLKKRFDRMMKHRRHPVKTCRYCRGWYKEVLQETAKIKNKKLRENLITVWKLLWYNNCMDFDIIAHEFEVKK